MKNLIIISLAITILFSISFTSAIPQIIQTQINLTLGATQNGNITTGNYDIIGEGGHLNNNFGINGNCTFNYSLANIPLMFSRDLTENDTDLATLIHALKISNNITEDYIECNRNLSSCMNDVGYKGNYTQAKAELDICYRARDDYSKQVSDKNLEISGLTTWRNLGVIFGIIGSVAAVWLYRKQQMKVLPNPYNAVSGVAKQY